VKGTPRMRANTRSCRILVHAFTSVFTVTALVAPACNVGANQDDGTRRKDVSEIVEANAAAAVAITADDDTGRIQISGVVIDPAGIVLTVAHGIEDVTKVSVYLKDGTVHSGAVVARDQRTDIALVRLEDASGLDHAVLGDATDLDPGDPLVVIGAPLGLRWSVSQGIVSSTERVYDGQRLIQTDADANPGSSGAPVFDRQGLLVALVKGRIPLGAKDQPVERLNFLVPINTTFPLLDQLGISSPSQRLFKRSLQTSDIEHRIELLDAAVRADPTNARAQFYLGVAYGDARQRDKQLAAFEQFARLRPNSFQAHRNLAICYLEAGRYDEALEHFSRAAELRPQSARVHNDLGETYRRMNKKSKARDELAQALRLNPTLPEAHFNLGLLLATGFNDARGAAKHFQRYLELQPNTREASDIRRWLIEQDFEEEPTQPTEPR